MWKLTQLADEVHRAVVAAVRRIQVDQELDIQASHLPLQDVGDGLPLILLVLPLSAGDVWTAEEETDDVHHGFIFETDSSCIRVSSCQVTFEICEACCQVCF